MDYSSKLLGQIPDKRALTMVNDEGASQMALTFELCEPTALAEGGNFRYVSIKKTRS